MTPYTNGALNMPCQQRRCWLDMWHWSCDRLTRPGLEVPHLPTSRHESAMQAKTGGAPGSAAKPGASQPTPSRAASQQLSQGGPASQQPTASGAEAGAATGKGEKGYAELFPKDSTNVVRWVGRWMGSGVFGESGCVWWPAVPLLHTLLLSPVRNDAPVCSLAPCPLPCLFCSPCHNCSAAPCPPLRSQPTQPCRATEMDAAAAGPPLSFEQAQADWQALLARMRARRQAAQVSGRKSRPCLVGHSLCLRVLRPCRQRCPAWSWSSLWPAVLFQFATRSCFPVP